MAPNQMELVENNCQPWPLGHYFLLYSMGYQGVSLVNFQRQDSYQKWAAPTDGAATSLTVDLERFLSEHAARLSLSRSYYAERRRGRPRKRRGIALAQWYGVDVTLLDGKLRLTPAERFDLLSANAEFVQELRKANE